MAFLTSLGITATKYQALTYFTCVCLFSISFLVFLNSAISFVITERIGRKHAVGDAVGTLGFADELLALVACPLWGVLSDRIGVRTVAVAGYTIVGLALFLVTFAKHVYPDLLLARLFFAIGGAATATMVTAILPSMTQVTDAETGLPNSTALEIDAGFAPSISSELTITPARNRLLSQNASNSDPHTASSQLAGYVGMFTGLGALIALLLFLPLPAHFQVGGQDRSQAVASSFYVVASVALIVAVVCIFGLADLPGESNKSIRALLQWSSKENDDIGTGQEKTVSYTNLLSKAVLLGIQDIDVGLAYVGGFVARASSVAISLFIPLFINAYFISSGRCPVNPDTSPHDPTVIKEECRKAYIVASKLTGVSQLVALLCAPLFGHLSARYKVSNAPLLLASAAGIAGNAAFGRLKSPDPAEGGGIGVYFLAMLIGIGQIGAIVCSLGLLARGIHTEENVKFANSRIEQSASGDAEATPLITPVVSERGRTRAHLKGSIAGVYSLAGGAGILVLTKVGGVMFDKVDPGTPFFIMAGFNGVLLAVGIACAAIHKTRSKKMVTNDDYEEHDG